MSSFIQFNYLYRDAGNYKSWGEVLFSNPDDLTMEEIDSQMRSNFEEEILFIAHQINIPELFLFTEQGLNDDDHCFHEYDSIELVERNEKKFDGRSIKEFLQQIKFASTSGWEVFPPAERLTQM